MRHPLERLVLRAIRRDGLVVRGDRVAVAVSGGSDSVALTWLLTTLSADLGITIAGLIHVNHGLRAEAAEDEAFCRELSARLSLPIEVRHVDVAALARERRRSVETAGREARYLSFADAALRLGATRVATGHTLDDQAETVLLRLFRGAGTRGLAGIRARRGKFIRPLLNCRREELRTYLAARGETFREDASNADCRIPRNRIRHELLPVIDRLAPGARRALARAASLAADDETFFRKAVIGLAPSVVLPDGCIRLSALISQPPALARRVLRFAIDRIVPDASLSAEHLGSILRLSRSSRPSGQLDLPGLLVRKEEDVLRIVRVSGDHRNVERAGEHFEYSLPCPGAVAVPEAGVTVLASNAQSDVQNLSNRTEIAAVSRASLELPLTVRNRRDGDRLRPLGAPGRRKLQDVLVDRKVPKTERDRLPIVTDARGRIVWIAGVTIAEEGRVKTAGEGVVILTVKKGLK